MPLQQKLQMPTEGIREPLGRCGAWGLQRALQRPPQLLRRVTLTVRARHSAQILQRREVAWPIQADAERRACRQQKPR